MIWKSKEQEAPVAEPAKNEKIDRDQKPVALEPVGRRESPASAVTPSVISANVTLKGSLTSTGDLQVNGKIEGDIRARSLVIGELAVVAGDIQAEDVSIFGRVKGGVRAGKVRLCASSHVEADVLYGVLAIDAGAYLDGNCRHSDNPLADTAADTAKAGQKKPAPNGYEAKAQALTA
jgi:cytoskeletal protein CcmA (bactofilin family)